MRALFAAFCSAMLVASALMAQSPRGDRTERLLEELCNAPAPSGFEGPVREIVVREFRTEGLETTTDGLGSVIAAFRGTSERPRIMVAAHMDEVGAMVKYITREGMVKFHPLGGWLDQALIDQRWTIVTAKGPLTAVSGLKSPHTATQEERTRVIPRDDVFLDVGARSKEDAESLGIRPGDPIVPAGHFTHLAHNRYLAKAMDDRVGIVMMLEALRGLKAQSARPANSIYFVATVQEELGLRGAHTAVQAVKPDLGISLEVGLALDHPGVRPEASQEKLGAGPVVFLADGAMLVNLHLRDFFERLADEVHIPYQTEVTTGASEDSAEMQRFGSGIPSINYAVPTRYLHTHSSELDRGDIDQSIELLVKALNSLDAKTVEQIARF